MHEFAFSIAILNGTSSLGYETRNREIFWKQSAVKLDQTTLDNLPQVANTPSYSYIELVGMINPLCGSE